MGNIVNQSEHDSDVQTLKGLAELCPAMSRYCSSHFRNSVAVALADLEMKDYEGVKAALNHLVGDLEAINL